MRRGCIAGLFTHEYLGQMLGISAYSAKRAISTYSKKLGKTNKELSPAEIKEFIVEFDIKKLLRVKLPIDDDLVWEE